MRGFVETNLGFNCTADPFSQEITDGTGISQGTISWSFMSTYARWTIYYAVAVLFLCLVGQLFTILSDRRYRNSSKAIFIPLKPQIMALSRLIGYRRLPTYLTYIGMPSSVGTNIFLGISLLYLCGVCFIPKFWYRACFAFGSPPLAVRAGLMANALTPLIYSFAGKVNVITLLTGVSYEKLNVFHRVTAWASFLLALVHVVPFFVQPLWEGGSSWLHYQYTSNTYYFTGIPAICFLFTLCFLSFKFIRRNYYEYFLHFHWPVAISYLGILYWHDGQALQSWAYLWSTLAVYGAGLLYRYFGKTNYMRLHENWFINDVANLRARDGNITEISIFSKIVNHWTPGQHIFVRFASIQPLSNHPFTIACVPTLDKQSGFVKLKMFAKSKKGFTKRLYDKALQNADESYAVLLDGPYGGLERDHLSFDEIVLVCSGSGATSCLPFLNNLAIEMCRGKTVRVQKIKVL